MNEHLFKLANIWSIPKPLKGAEAANQRCSIKSIFKNCTKFTGISICQISLLTKLPEWALHLS